MKAETYAMCAAREDWYWWHRARRVMVRNLLRKYGMVVGPRWLDLGCGPGGNLELPAQLSAKLVVGVDISPIARALARQKAPRASIVGADISRTLPFADDVFDVVSVFNVLYHSWIKSDVSVVAGALRVMRPGGLLVATEPSFSVLERGTDEMGMASRRYRCGQFAEICRAAGLEVLYSGYFTSFGFPLLLALTKLQSLRDRDAGKYRVTADIQPLPTVFNRLMYAVARFEGQMIEWGLRLPFGTTLVCVARKPSAPAASAC